MASYTLASAAMPPFKAKPALDKLPGELIANIAVKLGADDVFSLRLTCRSLEADSLHEFGSEHFSQKGFIFTTASLKVLVEIAKSKKFSKFLHTIYFVTALFHENQFALTEVDCRHSWNPPVRNSEAYHYLVKDQTQLVDSGKDVAMLKEAFSQLPKVAVIRFADAYCGIPTQVDVRGFNSTLRLTRTSPITLTDPRSNDPPFLSFKSHVWYAVLNAVSAQQLPTMTEIDAGISGAESLGLRAVDLMLSRTQANNLRKSLPNLQRLRICANTETASEDEMDAEVKANLKNAARSFGRTFSHVHDLVLSCNNDRGGDWDLEAMFSCYMLPEMVAAGLRRLTLDHASVNASGLVKLIRTMANMEFLELGAVDLLSGSWKTVLQALVKLPKLNHLHLFYCTLKLCKVYFMPQPDVEEVKKQLEGISKAMGHSAEGSAHEGCEHNHDHAHSHATNSEENTSENDESEDDPSEEDHSEEDESDEDESEVDDPDEDESVEEELEEEESEQDSDHHASHAHCATSSSKSPDLPCTIKPIVPAKKRSEEYPDCCTGPNFSPPGAQGLYEHGYYICLRGEEVAEYLPKFIKDCNTGEVALGSDMDYFQHIISGIVMGGGPPPPNFNAPAANTQGPAAPPGNAGNGGN